jgi:hypothetical protein
MATGPQDGEVLRRVWPMDTQRAFGTGSERDFGLLGAAVSALPTPIEEEGLADLFDRRLGKASARRVPIDKLTWMLTEYRTRYTGWNVKHFHEHLQRQHSFRWSYTWVSGS